ncbi:TlpA family protein disulfide reductase [Falsigemmobacter faecalis]|nr:TlpA disulfide reductase family protein [Falsigemmobacter faecalis]
MAGLSGLRVMLALAGFYTALGPGANPALADAALTALRVGEMRRLVVHETPQSVPEIAFADGAGAVKRFADWQGRVRVVNFWATWCAPCRAEMPGLDRLAREMPEVAVLTIATGRNLRPALDKFYEETGITDLPLLLDPKSAVARGLGVVGLPVTVVLDKEGREAARMIGEADWASAEAMAVLKDLAAR